MIRQRHFLVARVTALTKEHIRCLVNHFYQKVQQDELLGPVFNKVVRVNWDEHIPLLCQFWNSVMLKTNEYHGNAYQKHVELKKLTTLNEEQVQRWLFLFNQEAINHLPNEAAHAIISKAALIAESLKFGMLTHITQER